MHDVLKILYVLYTVELFYFNKKLVAHSVCSRILRFVIRRSDQITSNQLFAHETENECSLKFYAGARLFLKIFPKNIQNIHIFHFTENFIIQLNIVL